METETIRGPLKMFSSNRFFSDHLLQQFGVHSFGAANNRTTPRWEREFNDFMEYAQNNK